MSQRVYRFPLFYISSVSLQAYCTRALMNVLAQLIHKTCLKQILKKVFPRSEQKYMLPQMQLGQKGGKSRVHSVFESVVLDESGTAALSPREQRALRRKEKSRLAAKLRRNQESNILSCLLQALPVSLPDPSANSDGNSSSKSPPGLNLEKSGVIRMAGQTLFLYNSLSRLLGSKAMPFISLLSKSLFGLLVHPTDSTVVYATPPLAEAISWPWFLPARLTLKIN
ncbi:hypothetical protein ACTXT7_004188 [Hymenolepis weldensis]